MKDCINIILANAPLQNGNRGCVALTVSAISIIDEIMSDAGKKYKLMLADARIKSSGFDNKYIINGREICVEPILYHASYSIKSSIRLKLTDIVRKLLGKPSRDYFKDADFILNIGQGDSFADIYGEPRFHHINLSYRIARYYKKPYCVLPQTIGPFSNPNIVSLAVGSMNGAQIVMARDKQSYDYAKQIAPNANVKEYIDVAFFLPYNVIKQPEGKIHVGLNVSALLWNGGYTKNNQFNLECDYQNLIRSIVDYFLSINDVVIHLVAHVVEPDPGVENDYDVSYSIWKTYANERIVMAPFALSPIDIKSYIAGLDFFMGARMHATIAAFSSGVPVVPMSYSRKFNGLFEDTLNYHHVLNMKNTDLIDALDIIKEAFSYRKDLRTEVLFQNSTTVEARKTQLKKDIAVFLNL